MTYATQDYSTVEVITYTNQPWPSNEWDTAPVLTDNQSTVQPRRASAPITASSPKQWEHWIGLDSYLNWGSL